MSIPERTGKNTEPIPYVVHGSFRRHIKDINDAVEAIDSTGVAKAIAPTNCSVVSERDGFVILSGEENKTPQEIELEYVRKLLSLKALGGFSLFIATDGYIGKSAAYEYGLVHSHGVPAVFTEIPGDVPFRVDPDSVKTVEQLCKILVDNPNEILSPPRNENELSTAWNGLPFSTTLVAVGGIVRYQNRILLAEDGRWRNNQLTVPGTTVRARETRDYALQRALKEKFGIDPSNVASVKRLMTSFMIDGTGYNKPDTAIGSLVFDDRVIDLSSEHIGENKVQKLHLLSQEEIQKLIDNGDIEPNASSLLVEYFSSQNVA